MVWVIEWEEDWAWMQKVNLVIVSEDIAGLLSESEWLIEWVIKCEK